MRAVVARHRNDGEDEFEPYSVHVLIVEIANGG
jgi:hypothetical protein